METLEIGCDICLRLGRLSPGSSDNRTNTRLVLHLSGNRVYRGYSARVRAGEGDLHHASGRKAVALRGKHLERNENGSDTADDHSSDRGRGCGTRRGGLFGLSHKRILWSQWTSAQFWLVAAATCGNLLAFVLTIAVNVPINNKLMTWNVASTPANLKELWAPWDRIHAVRTIITVGVLILEAAALRVRASASSL